MKILSIILLVSIFIFPMCNYPGGELLPNEDSVWSGEVFEAISLGLKYPGDFFGTCMECLLSSKSLNGGGYAVVSTLIVLVFGIILLVGSIKNSKMVCRVSSLCGGIGLLAVLRNVILHKGFDKVIGTYDKIIAIGFWICLIIFICCFVSTLVLDWETNEKR